MKAAVARVIAYFREPPGGPEAMTSAAPVEAVEREHAAIVAHHALAVAAVRVVSTVGTKPFSPLADFADLGAMLDRRRRNRDA